mmetsp:Transcript_62938/g.73594  ORF Transcript_62938/g.73594 Transcript_62938/m.73594 type:complete len:481 (-) Transcript_62938:108-1550(-)
MASSATNHGTSSSPKPFSTFVAACFTLNYVMGTGILALPWAFHEAGIILSCGSLAVVCVLGILSSDYLLTAMARAEAVTSFQSSESTRLLLHNNNNNNNTPLMVHNRKFEITQLCRLFLGRAGERAYAISAPLYIYSILWAYTTVFGKAMSHSLPVPGIGDSYLIYVGVFSSIVVPLSFLEMPEQVSVQVTLSVCRFVMVFIMVLTPALVGLSSHHSASHGHYSFGGQTTPNGTPLWDTTGIPHMLPVVVFSVILHHTIPTLALEVGDKSNLHNVFGMTLAICIAAYTIIGLVGSWFFGADVEQSANLNWSDFRYECPSNDEHCAVAWGRWIAPVISFFTVIFPALDVISAFPLNAIVLSSNLRTIFYGSILLSDKKHTSTEKRFFKFASSVPPIIGAVFVRDLGTITDFSGLIGFAIGFVFPSLLYVFSERTMVGILGMRNVQTHYQRWGSNWGMATLVGTFGVGAIVYTCGPYIKALQ